MASTQQQRTKVPTKAKPDGSRTTGAASASGAQSVDSVAKRAYEIWRESGCVHGNDQAHWFQAEQELRGRTALH